MLDEVVEWAEKVGSDYLFVETAGLCLRCSPYVEKSLGVVVLEATSGMNLPRKIGPMLTLADISVITKIDLISQAEREVFRYRVLESAKDITVVETNALYGIGIDPIVRQYLKPMMLNSRCSSEEILLSALVQFVSGKKKSGLRIILVFYVQWNRNFFM